MRRMRKTNHRSSKGLFVNLLHMTEAMQAFGRSEMSSSLPRPVPPFPALSRIGPPSAQRHCPYRGRNVRPEDGSPVLAARPAGGLHYRAVVISGDDVEAARTWIAAQVRRTPVTMLEAGDLLPGTAVALKLEQLQHTGSFKARGALNRVLAVAYAAAREGVAASPQGTCPSAGARR